jgi:hypothetical protein
MNLAQQSRTAPGRIQAEPPERPPVILQRWRYSRVSREQLVGYVYNHPNPRFADGKWIRTSRIVWIREDVGLAQTLNTLYVLRDRAG